MKVYAPIGYYNDPEDIMDLFPCSTLKGDEADIIVKYMKDGYGNFHTIDGTPDEESYIGPIEASMDKNIVFTSDGQHLVHFSRGNVDLLIRGNDQHGFFIDIYKLIDAPGYEYSGLEESTIEKDLPFPGKPGIKEMAYDELCSYALDLSEKLKEAVIELKRRDAKKSK
jgi:hypothetical protein